MSNNKLDQDSVNKLLGIKEEFDYSGKDAIDYAANEDNKKCVKLPMLEVIIAKFNNLYEEFIKLYYSKSINIVSNNIEYLRLEEYSSNISKLSIIMPFTSNGKNFGFIEISRDLLYFLLDIMLGGKGNIDNVRYQNKTKFSSLENSILNQIFEQILKKLSTSFNELVPLVFQGVQVSNKEYLYNLFNKKDFFASSSNKITISDTYDLSFKLAFNYQSVFEYRSVLKQNFIGSNFSKDQQSYKSLNKSLHSTNLDIDVSIHRNNVPLSEIISYKLGDVIKLHKSITDEVSATCCNKELFRGNIGKLDNQVAIEINKIINSEKK